MITAERVEFVRGVRWWLFFVLLQVICHVTLSSLGAFFHFQLGHGIAIVENWLHQNGWEVALSAKLLALWLTHKLLQIRLYNPRGLRAFVRSERPTPDQRVLVVVVSLFTLLLVVAQPRLQPQNLGYLTHQTIAYFGIAVWFLADYFAMALLAEIFPLQERRLLLWRFLLQLASFVVSFRILLPDYAHTLTLMALHFAALVLIAGRDLQKLANVALYVLGLVAPLGTLFGLDPIWGTDFAPFRFSALPSPAFLLLLWVLSLAYYRFRHRLNLRLPLP